MTTPDDLAAQCRQCAADLASRNLLVSEAARGRAPGLLAGAADRLEAVERERDDLRDEKVHANVYHVVGPSLPKGGCWKTTLVDSQMYPTRAEAEAAYREKAFPGLDVDKDIKEQQP